MLQKCFKCGKEKELSEFYKHPQMTNGHLGKCKDCTKKDARVNARTDKSKDREKTRNKTEKRRKHISKISKNWRINNPEKYKAHNKLNNAIRDGKIIKPTKCEDCGLEKPLHGHHKDYSKPLDVDWFCAECHGKRNPNYIGVE